MVQPNLDGNINFSKRGAFKQRLKSMETQLREASHKAEGALSISYLSILKDAARKTAPIAANQRMIDDLKNPVEIFGTPVSYCSSVSSRRQSSQVDPPPTKRRWLNLHTTTTELETDSGADTSVTIQSDSCIRTEHIAKSISSAAHTPPCPTVNSVSWSLFASRPLKKPFLAADEIAQDPTLISAAYYRARQRAESSGQLSGCGKVFCPKSCETEEHIKKEAKKAKLVG